MVVFNFNVVINSIRAENKISKENASRHAGYNNFSKRSNIVCYTI